MGPAVSVTLPGLLDLLEQRRVLDAAKRRQVEVGAAQQQARLLRQHQAELDPELAARYQVSPAELIASFHLQDAVGAEIDEDRIAALVAAASGLSFQKIDPLALDMDLITRTVPRPFALRHVVLPIGQVDGWLVVAAENPFDLELTELMRRITPVQVRWVVASKRDILKAIAEVYGFRRSVESAARERLGGERLDDFEQLVRLRDIGELEETDQHVVNAVDFLLRYAFDQRASDIHIEPRRQDSQVRLRIDGVLHDTHQVPRPVHSPLVARIKAMSRLDIAEKRRPQDGRIKTAMGAGDQAREVELRVSTLPTAFGEKVVLRIFDPEVLLRQLPDLGFDPPDLELFAGWIGKPNGLLLITGPTGSGKTTTLYTTLTALASDTINVTSVEDPIEMITDRFNQVAVQPKIGVDFPAVLRAVLRQDPDIIMVGEIRDTETAEMAAQAALTGHLVLSTLHTNDTVGAVTRLADLGVPRYLITSTLLGVMAQRLVRKICDRCREPAPLGPIELGALGLDPAADAPTFAAAARGAGCKECRNTGYRGRIGIFELLPVDPALADQILAERPENELRQWAAQHGMRSLRQCALDRLAAAATTFEEVVRVIGPAVRGT